MTSNEEHQQQFRHWVDNIMYALALKVSGQWDFADYQKHMIKIAKEVSLQPEYIKEMEYELECYKMNLGVE